jgi:hypothetical protein
MKEMYRTIPFAPNYEVSVLGNVKNKFTQKILKPQMSTTLYHTLRIKHINGKMVNAKIHRLVALVFMGNPDNKRTINHKDGNKLNNKLSNLEWATDLENSQHARKIGLCVQGVGLVATNTITNEVFVFESRSECAKMLNTTKFYISRCVNQRSGIYKEWNLRTLEEYKYPRVPTPSAITAG